MDSEKIKQIKREKVYKLKEINLNLLQSFERKHFMIKILSRLSDVTEDFGKITTGNFPKNSFPAKREKIIKESLAVLEKAREKYEINEIRLNNILKNIK